MASSRDESGTWGVLSVRPVQWRREENVWCHGHAHCGHLTGTGVGSRAGKEPPPGPQRMRSLPGAQNQTLRRLEQVLHADSGPCLPHLLSRLCKDLGPGAFRLAARMYLQKGRCWWLRVP